LPLEQSSGLIWTLQSVQAGGQAQVGLLTGQQVFCLPSCSCTRPAISRLFQAVCLKKMECHWKVNMN